MLVIFSNTVNYLHLVFVCSFVCSFVGSVVSGCPFLADIQYGVAKGGVSASTVAAKFQVPLCMISERPSPLLAVLLLLASVLLRAESDPDAADEAQKGSR